MICTAYFLEGIFNKYFSPGTNPLGISINIKCSFHHMIILLLDEIAQYNNFYDDSYHTFSTY